MILNTNEEIEDLKKIGNEKMAKIWASVSKNTHTRTVEYFQNEMI